MSLCMHIILPLHVSVPAYNIGYTDASEAACNTDFLGATLASIDVFLLPTMQYMYMFPFLPLTLAI
jgi:hypothetical protein